MLRSREQFSYQDLIVHVSELGLYSLSEVGIKTGTNLKKHGFFINVVQFFKIFVQDFSRANRDHLCLTETVSILF